MKKIFKILPLLLTGAVATPIASMLSSCAPSTEYYIKYIDFNKIESDNTKIWTWNDMSSPNVSLKKLLYGTTKFNGGNYAIMLGTPTANSSDKKTSKTFDFIFSDAHTSTYNISNFSLNNSYLYQAWSTAKTEYIKDFAGGVSFITLMDLWTESKDHPNSVISPFAKWTEDQDDYYNRDHKDQNPPQGLKVKKNTWIRNDEGAKLFRDYVTEISTLFPDFENKFLSDLNSSDTWACGPLNDSSTSCVDNAPYFIFWKDGKPQGAKAIDVSNSKALTNELKTIYGSDDSSNTTN